MSIRGSNFDANHLQSRVSFRRTSTIVRYDRDRAIDTLPLLLNDAERERLSALLERVINDKRVLQRHPTAQQAAMLDRVRKALGGAHESSMTLTTTPVRKARATART